MIEQKLKPNREILGLKDLELEAKQEPKYVEHKLEQQEIMPRVFYYGVELPTTYIKKMIVDSNKFMPTCYVEFQDLYSILHDVGYPTDNAKLLIILPTNEKTLANIFMEFKIERYHVLLNRDSTSKRIAIWGICNVENMLIKKYASFLNISSFDLTKKLAEETGLGLMSNVDSSKDIMTWINSGQHVYSFLQDTLNKAWVGETGYIWGFVDFYYNLNFIDVEKSLSQDIKEIKWVYADQKQSSETQSRVAPPMLTNDPSVKSNNSFFTGEKIINQSTETSLQRGYLRNVHYYDIDGKWEDKSGAYKIYALDTITTPGNDDTTIILKGDPGNLDFYNKNTSVHYLDKLDTKNMYTDYLWAKIQNEENLYDLQKISMQIILPTPNFNIKRFEKLQLLFVNNNSSVNTTNTQRNIKLNGEWLCTGLTYEWNGQAFFQYINIVKRELNVGDL